MTRKKTKSPFDQVTSHLAELSRPELVELADMVAALLAALDEEQPDDQVAAGDVGTAKAGAGGSIELKMIPGKNGTLYGPYAYLRYWVAGVHKSKYIGKLGGPKSD